VSGLADSNPACSSCRVNCRIPVSGSVLPTASALTKIPNDLPTKQPLGCGCGENCKKTLCKVAEPPHGQPQSPHLGDAARQCSRLPSQPAPPLVDAERCYMPARARTRGPTRPNEPPRRPFPSTHTGRWAHARNPPPLTWPGDAQNLRRETARLSKHTSRQSQPHTETPLTDASGRAITRHGPTRQQSHSTFHTHGQRGTRLGHRRPTR